MVPVDVTEKLRPIKSGDRIFSSVPDKIKSIVNENFQGFITQHPTYGNFLMHDVLALQLMMHKSEDNVAKTLKQLDVLVGG